MKKTMMMLAVLYSSFTHAAPIPVCDEEVTVQPCLLPEADAGLAVSDMLFHNQKGFNAIASKAKIGFEISEVRATLVSEIARGKESPLYKSEMKYEILLNDMRGTDYGYGIFLWTVVEKSVSDGYTSQSTFTDTLVKANDLPPNQ